MYSVPEITRSQFVQRSVLQQVYAWMAGGLTLTGLVAMWSYSSGFITRLLMRQPNVFIGLLIGEIVLVVAMTWGINRMSSAMATGAFLLYSAVNGLTMAVIFLAYTQASIASTFLVTAGTFAGMSAYGYATKRDLTSWRAFLMMGLLGFVLASLVNLFMRSEAVYWISTYLGIIIFVGLTAYDTQKIKHMTAAVQTHGDPTVVRRVVLMGALTLYLDFINLFLLLLRLFGRRR